MPYISVTLLALNELKSIEYAMQSLDLSSFDTSNVTTMPGMFNQCKAQSLDLRPFDTSNVTTMGGMFNGCKAQSIDLSSFNTCNAKDMYCMFDGCKAQINITDSKLKDQLKRDREG